MGPVPQAALKREAPFSSGGKLGDAYAESSAGLNPVSNGPVLQSGLHLGSPCSGALSPALTPRVLPLGFKIPRDISKILLKLT